MGRACAAECWGRVCHCLCCMCLVCTFTAVAHNKRHELLADVGKLVTSSMNITSAVLLRHCRPLTDSMWLCQAVGQVLPLTSTHVGKIQLQNFAAAQAPWYFCDLMLMKQALYQQHAGWLVLAAGVSCCCGAHQPYRTRGGRDGRAKGAKSPGGAAGCECK